VLQIESNHTDSWVTKYSGVGGYTLLKMSICGMDTPVHVRIPSISVGFVLFLFMENT
jgi:hypothetical protein